MGLIFNGKSSRDFGLVVESYPALNHGAKRGEAYQIAGRNGTCYREDGTYDNYIQAYDVAVIEGERRRADLRAADIAAWLLSPSGFCRLEDIFEPEYFKLARYAGPLNIAQILGRWGRCTLEFDCRPERWLRSGEAPVFGNTSTIPDFFNPTSFNAKPLINLGGSSSMTLSVNSQQYLTVQGQGSNGPVIIDCDTGTITDAAGVNLMGSVNFAGTYDELPVFGPGDNTVTVSNVSSWEITPRWWTL